MNQETKQALAQSLRGFHLPRYHEIPNVGLYLEQVTKYIGEYLAPLGQSGLTSYMISNYVKKGLVASPVKKQYDRELIAHLLFIALAKNVMSLDDLQKYIELQQRTYAVGVAYDYFCDEFEALLGYVFHPSEETVSVPPMNNDEKTILRNIVITIAHKIYLEKYIAAVTEELLNAPQVEEGLHPSSFLWKKAEEIPPFQ